MEKYADLSRWQTRHGNEIVGLFDNGNSTMISVSRDKEGLCTSTINSVESGAHAGENRNFDLVLSAQSTTKYIFAYWSDKGEAGLSVCSTMNRSIGSHATYIDDGYRVSEITEVKFVEKTDLGK